MAAQIYKNLIGGDWVASRSGQTFENLNPAAKDSQVRAHADLRLDKQILRHEMAAHWRCGPIGL